MFLVENHLWIESPFGNCGSAALIACALGLTHVTLPRVRITYLSLPLGYSIIALSVWASLACGWGPIPG